MPKLIRDRYEPLAIAGRGGQGEVIRALDRMHDRIVAIKVRPVPEGSRRPELLSEARILLSMRPHPLVSLVREDFFEADRYYLVMDWVEGKTLHTMLAEAGGSIPLDDAVSYLADVGEALEHLHAQGIVHKDVKPANVIVTSEGRAVLVDFGISAGAGAGRGSLGTRGYTAPELLSGGAATPASDVFGLAATAFASLTGAPPRAGHRPRWKAIPKDRAKLVELALTRGLSFDPSRRQATAGELVSSMRSTAPAPGNLPLQLTSFVGREELVDEVSSLIEGNRLVTLAGPGGIGKTRLAIAAAGASFARRTDGVWLAELAAVVDGERVPQALASTLDVRESAGGSVIDALLAHLQSRDALVVLDNCEHVLEAAAALVKAILASCPKVRVLATSRESLGIGGEAIVRVPPLAVPNERASPDQLASVESVALFLERARLVLPSFGLREDNEATIAKLVARLEGLPLAIELAAARVRSLAPAEILARLDDRFRLLSSKKGDARSLRAVVDWSYDLLDEPERSLLQTLSVFVGGFTLDAAEHVAGAVVDDGLEHLVDKSLVTFDDAADPPRYGMLETIRAYAEERLREAGRSDEVRSRHRDVYESLALGAETSLETAEQPRWLDMLEAEHGNIRHALRWNLTTGAPEPALRMSAALWRFWDMRGYLTEGRAWIEEALSLPGEASGEARAKALRGAAGLALDQGDYDTARTLHERSVVLAREAGARATEAAALNGLAIGAGAQSDFDSERRLYLEALEILRDIGNKRGIAVTLGNLGTAAFEQGDPETAHRYLTESLEIRRELGDKQGLAQALNGLALVAGALGDDASARRMFEESLELWGSIGYRRGVAIALLNLGTAALRHGDHEQARSLLSESTGMLRELGVKWDLAECLHALGDLAYASRDTDAAAARYAESLDIRMALGDKRGCAEGLEALAGVAVLRSRHADAVAVYSAARSMREAVGARRSPPRETAVERDLAAARKALDDEAFNAAGRRGSGLAAEAAAALAVASAAP